MTHPKHGSSVPGTNAPAPEYLMEDVATAFPALHAATTTTASVFARFEHFLERQVRPTREYASGGEAFELLLRHAHVASSGADGVEGLALERIAIEDAALRTAPPPPTDRTVPAPAADYLTRFDVLWRTVRDLACDRDVLTFPDWPVRFVNRPPWADAPHRTSISCLTARPPRLMRHRSSTT